MKTPPFLLGATLLFWGWQTGLPAVGAIMAVVLESTRSIKARWEFTDEDFSRIWTFCSLLMLAAAVYAFTANEGPANFSSLFQDPTFAAQGRAGIASARTATALIRWLPMIFFLFVAAQAFGTREEIPIATLSLILRRRRRQAEKMGWPVPPSRGVNPAYPFFGLCLFAASAHVGENNSYFWGLSALLTWTLWCRRSHRFGVALWSGALAVAIVGGFLGQSGISRLQGLIGSYNPQWFSAFKRRGFDPTQSKTTLGQVGRLKASGRIVIRLEPKAGTVPPVYLREASYRTYRSQVWYAGPSREDFVNVNKGTNETTWLLLPGKTNSASINIACYLDGGKALLPLPTGSGRLENLPAYTLQKNSAGAVLAEGPGLVIFDALYGAGATVDSAPDANDTFNVPRRESPAIDQTIATWHLSGQDPERVRRTISAYFQSQFSYSIWQEPGSMANTNETPLSRFLLSTHRGHCEYFATATVLLLRQLGIPARYAVGYAVHETSGRGYVVRERDAHAWCLVWNEAGGVWQDFDTTPSSWVAEEGNNASPMQWLSDLWSRMGFEFSKFRQGQTRLRQYVLWALVPVMGLLLYQIIFRRKWRRQPRKLKEREAVMTWPGLDSEFYQLERKLTERGVARLPGELLSHWLSRAAADADLADLGGSLRALLHLHYRHRFDPPGLSQSEREALRREAGVCLQGLVAASRAPARDPRSGG